MAKALPLVILSIALCLSLFVGFAVGADGYSLDVQDTFETPEETIEVEQDGETESYTIDELAVVSEGEDLRYTTRVPDEDTTVEVFLYRIEDGERTTVDREVTTGEEQVEIDTTGIEPGSYVLAMYDGNYRHIVPVVIGGYEVTTIDYPSEASQDETMDVSVEINEVAPSDAVTGVDVVIWDDNSREEISLEESGDGVYETTVDLSQFEDGDYELYAIVRGEDTVYENRRDILGAADSDGLTVTDGSENQDGDGSDTDDDSDGDNDSGGETDEPDDDSSGNETDTDGNETDTSTNETDTDGNETDTSTNETDTDGNETDTSTDDADDESVDDDDSNSVDDEDGEDNEDNGSSVIEPNESDADSNESEDSDGDESVDDGGTVPLSIWIAVVAIVASVLALRSTLTE